jgi:hypothetical protein
MIRFKTPGAADVIEELVQDNRSILDDLISDTDLGFNWLLRQLTTHPESVDHKFLNLLASFCVCEKLAVRSAQVRSTA